MARAGKSEATGRLDHQLHAFGKEAHRLDQLLVGGGDDVVHLAADDLERQLADVRRLRAVGNGFRHLDVHDLAAPQRLLRVVARQRLHAVELAAR